MKMAPKKENAKQSFNNIRKTKTITETIRVNKSIIKESLSKTRSGQKQKITPAVVQNKPLEVRKKITKKQPLKTPKKQKVIPDHQDNKQQQNIEKKDKSQLPLSNKPEKKQFLRKKEPSKEDIKRNIQIRQQAKLQTTKQSIQPNQQKQGVIPEKSQKNSSQSIGRTNRSIESHQKKIPEKKLKKSVEKKEVERKKDSVKKQDNKIKLEEKQDLIKKSEKKTQKLSEKMVKPNVDEEDKQKQLEANTQGPEINQENLKEKTKSSRKQNSSSAKKKISIEKKIQTPEKQEEEVKVAEEVVEKKDEGQIEEQNKDKKPTNEQLISEQVQPEEAKLPRRAETKSTTGIVDVVFCCDTTSSMDMYINQAKETVKTIVQNIKEKSQNEDISVRFGFVCYRDHPPQDNTYVTRVKDLCSDVEIIEFIDQQTAEGGGKCLLKKVFQGDYPEAVLDGLHAAATQISWRDASKQPSLRYIFHLADAPPHGKEFGHQSQWSEGVPSGINLEKVIHVINIREIHYRLIDLNGRNLRKMAGLFKANFTNFEETTLQFAKDMNIVVSDMIIRELLPDIDYND